MGKKWTCHTSVSERNIVRATKTISNWKAPRHDLLQIFWSELLKTAHRASAKCSVEILSEPAICLICMAPWKNCYFSAIFSCLTKTDQLCVHLPSLEKHGTHLGIMRAMIPTEILKSHLRWSTSCNDQGIWDLEIVMWPTKRKFG